MLFFFLSFPPFPSSHTSVLPRMIQIHWESQWHDSRNWKRFLPSMCQLIVSCLLFRRAQICTLLLFPCLALLLYQHISAQASLSPSLPHHSSFINLSQYNEVSLCLSRSSNAGIHRSMQNGLLTLLLFINLLEMHSENPSILLRLMTDWFIARETQHLQSNDP